MALILTFLGEIRTDCTTLAIATAKQLAQRGKRVLLVSQGTGPVLGLRLGTPLGPDPQAIAPGLEAVQLETTVLLERSWEEVKKQESQYLRSPFLRTVYGQELGILPGMDSALALNALREFEAGDRYDVLIYDGPGDQSTLRMLGMPEILSWYLRRFRKVFLDSDFVQALSPFVMPVTSAVLNVNWSLDDLSTRPTADMNNQLDRGQAAIADPQQVRAYLVTRMDPGAIALAQYLWGSAQQVNLTIGGVIVHPEEQVPETISQTFQPLPLSAVPQLIDNHWQPVMERLPDFLTTPTVPRPLVIESATGQISLFLPTFEKNQVKLTQYGPEITIEAGDQRRNIVLPPELGNRSVVGAKFQAPYLIITLS